VLVRREAHGVRRDQDHVLRPRGAQPCLVGRRLLARSGGLGGPGPVCEAQPRRPCGEGWVDWCVVLRTPVRAGRGRAQARNTERTVTCRAPKLVWPTRDLALLTPQPSGETTCLDTAYTVAQ
jgi:hypothetical protein